MDFHSFNNPDTTITVWRLVVIGILVLLLRRLPIMLVLYKWIPDVRTFREAVFSGHFGPSMYLNFIFVDPANKICDSGCWCYFHRDFGSRKATAPP
jgi:sodium/hydrogen antiporter